MAENRTMSGTEQKRFNLIGKGLDVNIAGQAQTLPSQLSSYGKKALVETGGQPKQVR